MRNKERKMGNQKREQDQKKGKKENGKYETEIEREKKERMGNNKSNIEEI